MDAVVFDPEPFLKISNSPVLLQFLHECVDDLIGKTTANFNNYNSDIEWTIEDYNKARRNIQIIYKQFVINNKFDLNPEGVNDDLYKAIKDCYEIRSNEIFQVLVEEAVRNKGHNLVKNFDWRLKWVMGSSKLATVREPLLQVDLQCKGREDKGVNFVNFEANLEKLDEFIRELSAAQKELDS